MLKSESAISCKLSCLSTLNNQHIHVYMFMCIYIYIYICIIRNMFHEQQSEESRVEGRLHGWLSSGRMGARGGFMQGVDDHRDF